MKILHFGTLDTNAGGPAMSVYNTLVGLNEIGVRAEILMNPLSINGKLIGEKVPTHFARQPIENKFGFSTSLHKKIQKLGEFDVYHAQGVWQYPTYLFAYLARKYKIPYLVTPRGMLYPQDIAKASTEFKKLSLKIRLLADLNKAACVHATSEEEMVHLRNLGVSSPIAIIPNPIKIDDLVYEKQDAVFRLGYLGRLSKRKNVEGLLYAWHHLGNKTENAELLIIGKDDEVYEQFLKDEVKRLEFKNVKFIGFLNGKEKDQAIANLSVLVMPSEFENFGMVIIEALKQGVPCIATKGAPWQELETQQCGWWIDYNQQALNKAVEDAYHKTPLELKQMGENGKNLVKNTYSNEIVAEKMKLLYEWVIDKKEKPDFVYLR
jgi:glycosyltransferase involved in cell wall biosynthesis